MILTLTLDDAKYACLLTKEQGDAVKAEGNILDKVNEYLDACARDVGMDDLANVRAELEDPVKLAAVKAALGL